MSYFTSKAARRESCSVSGVCHNTPLLLLLRQLRLLLLLLRLLRLQVLLCQALFSLKTNVNECLVLASVGLVSCVSLFVVSFLLMVIVLQGRPAAGISAYLDLESSKRDENKNLSPKYPSLLGFRPSFVVCAHCGGASS